MSTVLNIIMLFLCTLLPLSAYIYIYIYIYRVIIKSFPDYKHLLQGNYCTWNTNIFFQNVAQEMF